MFPSSLSQNSSALTNFLDVYILQLRDHLALSATCRFFRACYTDDVWQALFQAEFPKLVINLADIGVHHAISSQRDYYRRTVKDDPSKLASYVYDSKGDVYGSDWDRGYSVRTNGPHLRGWRAARTIFTRGIDGTPGAVRWGQSKTEWDAGEANRQAARDELKSAILSDETYVKKFRTMHESGKMTITHPLLGPEETILVDLTAADRECVCSLLIRYRSSLSRHPY